MIMSDDTGVRLKARQVRIDYCEPPAEIRLPDEPDPLQKKVKELEAELARLKNALPNLCVGFRKYGEIDRKIVFAMKFNQKGLSPQEIE
jgi:hypothetical protein